jgi:calcyclin binding protein
MVSFEEIPDNAEIPASQERLLDAQAIEEAAAKIERPTARMQLEGLAKRLRKESEALKRVENSRRGASEDTTTPTTTANPASPPVVPPPEQPKAPPKPEPAPTPPVVPNGYFVPIDRFSFDAGSSSAPFVTVYVDLPRVGSIARDLVTCDFTSSSFDMIVKDLNGKSYRLWKENLEKDIDTEKSKIIVKADKIVIKLAKIKGDYGGYDYWSKLTDKKADKKKGKAKAADPQSSIMELMKNMYDDGDDNMRKVIGESMLKQRQGGLDNPDFGKDLGGFDDA